MIRRVLLAAALLAASLGFEGARAQSVTEAQAMATMSDKELMKLPAKKVFSGEKLPTANMKARAIGFYARGCMAGGAALPVDGPAWQAMRLSRNRNWGQPELVALVEASVPKYVADLRAAWQAGDLRTLASLAHTISGAVGNVGAAHLAGVARAVEQTARSANPVDEAAVRGLEQAAQELLQRMRAWVATLPASGQVART